MNSRSVRPLETTREEQTTNGAHAIHHAEEQCPVTQPLIGWVAGRSLCISEIIGRCREATEEITDILNQLAKQLSGLAGNQDHSSRPSASNTLTRRAMIL